MQPAVPTYWVLSLIALLAPLPAAAFGDLDCITTEVCTDAICAPDAAPLSVTFDWASETARVTANGSDTSLPWAATQQPDDTLATVILYGDTATTRPLLRLEANGTDITALYTFDAASGAQTWAATCDVRQAA